MPAPSVGTASATKAFSDDNRINSLLEGPVWGSGTVLAMDKLNPEDRAGFDAIERGIATLTPEELGQTLPEPHPSWMVRIEQDWTARYGVGQ